MAQPDPSEQTSELVDAGHRSLAAGDWQAGRTFFEQAIKIVESAEALEGLGLAAWWLDDVPVVFESRERAFGLYRRRGDDLGAARMAAWLSLDHSMIRGERAIASGWLERARRLLLDAGPGVERCLLHLAEGHIALFDYNDPVTARRSGSETVRMARELGLIDLEMLGLALEGLSMVSSGQVDEGMRRLDESTVAALSGEMADIDAIATACCCLIYACERVRDFERAAQWCGKVQEFCQRWSYQSLFTYCRIHYGTVLMWQGDWTRAESELVAAHAGLIVTRAGWARDALARLGELRRRQGRLEEANDLFKQVPTHPQALLGQAELALARGDSDLATDAVERYLRRVPRSDLTEHVVGLEVAVRVHVAHGALDRAREALAGLEGAAGQIGTLPHSGSVRFAQGVVSQAEGEDDLARQAFEDAIDLFSRSGAPYETALARLELAEMLATLARTAAAAVEGHAALETFLSLGADGAARRATDLLRRTADSPAADGQIAHGSTGLTRRETEVLLLVATGRSNQEIADALFLSVRTVERHISTIYQKIGVRGRAARVTATAYAIEHGLTTPQTA